MHVFLIPLVSLLLLRTHVQQNMFETKPGLNGNIPLCTNISGQRIQAAIHIIFSAENAKM
jgi:hypothetical protein